MSKEKPKEPPQGSKIQVQLDDATAQGAYSNLAMIYHSENEFVIDFAYLQPGPPRAKIRSRVILSPKHARRLLDALSTNIQKYEERFGPVAPLKEDSPTFH
jgi:hypothetical protein